MAPHFRAKWVDAQLEVFTALEKLEGSKKDAFSLIAKPQLT